MFGVPQAHGFDEASGCLKVVALAARPPGKPITLGQSSHSRMSWAATMWGGFIELETPMLFAI
jgi:hypothetical protein